MEVEVVVDYWVLDNGARLVSEEIPHLRSVAMGIYVGVGSRDEADEMNGTTHFIEHLLFKGTATRTAKDIAEAFESIGGQLNAYTSKEYTCFYARTLDENFEEALDILFDMVFNSVFMDKDLLTEKGVIVEEIGMYEDSPDELIHDVFSQLLWRNHALGRPILGTKETVMALKRESVIEYYRQYYVPSNMVIAIAGNINNSMVRDKVSEWLHRVQNHPVSRAKLPPDIPPKNELRLITKDTEQVQLCIGTPSISYSHDERHVQNIMNSILGGGIGSRLFQTIREEKGLAYSVYTYPTSYSDSGSFCIYAATSPEKINDLMAGLGEELDKFRTNGVTADEINRAQRQIKANMYLGMESVMNRMSRLGKSVMFYDRIIPLEEVIDNIMAVTADDIQRFANQVLVPDKLCLAAIGGKEVLSVVEKGLSSVTRMGCHSSSNSWSETGCSQVRHRVQ